jgi:hypothetical protein
MDTPFDPGRCPLCGRPNDCDLIKPGTPHGPCWCWRVKASPEALQRVPAELRGRVCLCRECLTGMRNATGPLKAASVAVGR